MTAAREARIRIETGQADAARRLRSAVADVVDGDVTINDACRNRGVDYDTLRKELAARGWAPVRVRQTNSRSRARKP